MYSKLRINYLPELTAFLFGRSKPSMVTINLTEKCNQKCVYCEIGNNIQGNAQDKIALAKEDLLWIIDQMHLNKITRLSLCGGEPFLFREIIEIVSYAWQNNIRCNITSNGMIIHKLSNNDLEILKQCGSSVNISIDSFDERIQETTRGVGSALSNALKSISCLREKQIPVTVLTAISRYNYQDLYESFIKAYNLGITQILYQPIIYYSNYPDKPVIEQKACLNVDTQYLDILKTELHKIYAFEKKHRISTNIYRILPWIFTYITTINESSGRMFFKDILKRVYCRELYSTIDISYDGDIQPCGLSPAEINIRDNQKIGLLHQWINATSKLRNEITLQKFPQQCNGCCHKFSRNMIASVMKYPLSNRIALVKVSYNISSRIVSVFYKKLFIKK